MAEDERGRVTYRPAGEEYFAQRGLRRFAGVWSLWALGVGAVIAYIMQMAAYLKIKSIEGLERPYLSPLGRPGAAVALAIAAVTLVFLFVNPDYRPGVYGVALWFVLSLVYFAFHARHQMILSPEEEFAEASRSAGRGSRPR